jgi:glutaredoxin
VVLTRPDCHLCEQAIAVIEAICAETGESYEERNVDRDPQLQRQYGDQVPVTFVDGRQHDFWRVDPDRLRSALAN